MSEPPSTRCERFSSDAIFFYEICNNCKKNIEAIQIKQKKLNWNGISLLVGNNLFHGKTYICFYKKKL